MKRILSLILCLVLAVSLLPLSAAAAGTPTVRVSSAQAKVGETITLDVAVENNPGIYALTFRFNYDTSRLRLTAVTPNADAFPGTWQAGGLKGATWASNVGDITANGTILSMTFEVLEEAEPGDARVEIVLGEIINADMDDIEFVSVPGVITIGSGDTPQPSGDPTVRVPSAEAKAGETVTLNVAVENNPGIFALTFSFNYDTTRLKLTAVTPNKQSFPGSWQAASLKGATWASNAGDITANDTILTMTFEVLADAAAGDANVEVVLGEIINEDMDDIEFASVPGAVTVAAGTPAVIRTASATFEGKVGLNYTLTLPDYVLEDAGAYAEYTLRNGTKVRQLVTDAQTVSSNGQIRYMFTCNMVAKEFGDLINFKLYSGDGTQIRLESNKGADLTETGFNYSIVSYIEAILKQSTNENMKALANATREYGIAAQLYFDYYAEGLAVSDEVKAVNASALDPYKGTQNGTLPAEVASGVSMATVFESDNAIRLNIKFTDSADPTAYVYKIDGADAMLQHEGSQYYLEVSNIAAKDLGVAHSFEISGDGWTYQCSLSGLTYARVFARSSDENKQNFGKAIYLYNQAAIAYFGE